MFFLLRPDRVLLFARWPSVDKEVHITYHVTKLLIQGSSCEPYIMAHGRVRLNNTLCKIGKSNNYCDTNNMQWAPATIREEYAPPLRLLRQFGG